MTPQSQNITDLISNASVFSPKSQQGQYPHLFISQQERDKSIVKQKNNSPNKLANETNLQTTRQYGKVKFIVDREHLQNLNTSRHDKELPGELTEYMSFN